MTLLTTEILNPTQPDKTVIVFAADRRLSEAGRQVADRIKVMPLHGLNGGIGYFGRAEVPTGTGRFRYMDEWLTDFMRSRTWVSLGEFSYALANELNAAVPTNLRTSSGLHVAGFTPDGRVEFWYVRTIDDQGRPTLGSYQAREDFQREHAAQVPLGGDWIYRNGDIRGHVAAWDALDTSLGALLNSSTFKVINTPEDYVKWVKFKMETIAHFYAAFSTVSIIGLPVDAFAITNQP